MMAKKKLAVVVATMAAMTVAAVPAYAQEDAAPNAQQEQQAAAQVAGSAQYAAPQAPQGEEVSVTGVIEHLPADGGPSPYGVTDEASGVSYVLDRGEGDYSAYEGQKVTITGVAQTDPNIGFYNLYVSGVAPAGADGAAGPSEDRTATLSFEAKTDCAPPEGTTLLGFVPAEGGISAVLTDPDGDGVYTGSVEVPRFAPGPTPPGTEPVSVPVQIGQNVGDDSGNIETIKNFGQVKLDGDKAFSADASFCGDGSGGTDNGNGGAVVSGDTSNADKGGSGSEQGSASPVKNVLPSTGGILPVAAAASALLLGGGFVARRLLR